MREGGCGILHKMKSIQMQRGRGGFMERGEVVADLKNRLEILARLHVQHGLYGTEGYLRHKDEISHLIKRHRILVRKELDPISHNLYRRYFY